MTWLAIALLVLLSLLLVWRFRKLSEREERRRIIDGSRVEQLEKKLQFYVHDLYDKVLGANNMPAVGWWLIQSPVITHEGRQVHLMDIVGFGLWSEAREYAEVLGKKHGGQFKPTQLTAEQYQKLWDQQQHLIGATLVRGRHMSGRPFVHHADWLSEALATECEDAADDRLLQHAPLEALAGSWWVDGRLVKAKSLWEQLRDLQRQVGQL